MKSLQEKLKNGTLIRFLPEENKTHRQLIKSDLSLRCLYVDQCMYFQGEINIERYTEALGKTLKIFSFYFGRLEKIDGKTYIVYSGKTNLRENYAVHLELNNINTSLQKITVQNPRNYLPSQVQDPRMTNYWLFTNFVGCPMLAIKLTYFDGGFIIASIFHHILSDQSTYVYFLKNLSNIYMGKTPLPKPIIIRKNDLLESKILPSIQNKEILIPRENPSGTYTYFGSFRDQLSLAAYGIKQLVQSSSKAVFGLKFKNSSIRKIKTSAKNISTIKLGID